MKAPGMFGVVILAAGASLRMGRPKMLLPWGSSTVLGRLIEQWREIGAAQIAVACVTGDANLNAELDRLGVSCEQRIVNPNPSRGMFSSIRCAAQWGGWNRELTHIAVALGDQPHLTSETLRAIAELAASRPENICQPSYRGRARHPVFIPAKTFKSIATATAGTLKEFLRSRASEVRTIEVDDPGLDLDLDTPADYEKARQYFRGEK